MKKLLCAIFLLCYGWNAQAQLSASFGYAHLYAPEWDNAFYAYNFARPWNKKELSPLIHGYEGSLGWIVKWKAIKSLYIQPKIGFSHYTSSANNNGERMKVRLNIYSTNFSINFNPRAFFRNVSAGPLGTRFFLFLNPGFHLLDPHGEKGDFTYSSKFEKKSDDFSYAFSLGLGAGYRTLMIAKKFIVTPIIGGKFMPNVSNKNLPYIVNGGDQLSLQQKAKMVWIWDASVEITWIFPRKKSGKGYIKPCTNC